MLVAVVDDDDAAAPPHRQARVAQQKIDEQRLGLVGLVGVITCLRERELLIELFEDFSLRNGRFVSPVSGDLQGMPVKLPRTVNDERRKTA